MPDAGPHRGPGPQTGQLAHFVPPARLALTTDSALGTHRSGQAHCARLVAPSRSRPEDRPPARWVDALQRSGTLRPPGSAQQIPAGGPSSGSAGRRSPAVRHTVPAWQRPADPGGRRTVLRPGGSTLSSDRAGSAARDLIEVGVNVTVFRKKRNFKRRPSQYAQRAGSTRELLQRVLIQAT